MHPAPPEDLAGLVRAFEHTVQSVIDLGQSCSARDFDEPTECPGWTVKDQISHVVGIESWLDGAPTPRLDLPDLPHVKNEAGRFIELWVHERRPLEGEDVVGELEDVLASRTRTLRDPDLLPETVVKGPSGRAPAATVLTQRICDVWVHEQDIRAALGRPGNLDSPAAAVFVSVIIARLPRIVAKSAGIEVGQAVIFDITGPVVGRAGARVVEGQDGVPHGDALFTGEQPEAGAEGTFETTSITLTTDALTRCAAGRRPVAEVPHTVHGNADVARRVMEHLCITH